MGIRIGSYNQRVVFQRATYTKLANGGTAAVWSDQLTTWAEVVPNNGGQSYADGQKQSSRPVIVRVRSRFDYLPNEQWRIIWRECALAITSFMPIAKDVMEIMAVQNFEAATGNNSLQWGYTQGESKNILFNIKAFIYGATASNQMTTALNSLGYLPLTSPFADGKTTASFADEVVDWVYIRALDGPSDDPNLARTVVSEGSWAIMSDGQIAEPATGLPVITFTTNRTLRNLFFQVKTRNHLSIITATPVEPSGGIYTYDFSSSASQAYGANQLVSGDVYCMYPGDINQDGIVSFIDTEAFNDQVGQSGYKTADLSFNGQVNTSDKNTLLTPYLGREVAGPKQ